MRPFGAQETMLSTTALRHGVTTARPHPRTNWLDLNSQLLDNKRLTHEADLYSGRPRE